MGRTSKICGNNMCKFGVREVLYASLPGTRAQARSMDTESTNLKAWIPVVWGAWRVTGPTWFAKVLTLTTGVLDQTNMPLVRSKVAFAKNMILQIIAVQLLTFVWWQWTPSAFHQANQILCPWAQRLNSQLGNMSNEDTKLQELFMFESGCLSECAVLWI